MFFHVDAKLGLLFPLDDQVVGEGNAHAFTYLPRSLTCTYRPRPLEKLPKYFLANLFTYGSIEMGNLGSPRAYTSQRSTQ